MNIEQFKKQLELLSTHDWERLHHGYSLEMLDDIKLQTVKDQGSTPYLLFNSATFKAETPALLKEVLIKSNYF